MEIVREARRDVRRETCYQVPRLLRPIGRRRDASQLIPRKKAADIGLYCVYAGEVVHAVASHEMPILAEVMVEPSHTEVGLYWRHNRSLKALDV